MQISQISSLSLEELKFVGLFLELSAVDVFAVASSSAKDVSAGGELAESFLDFFLGTEDVLDGAESVASDVSAGFDSTDSVFELFFLLGLGSDDGKECGEC